MSVIERLVILSKNYGSLEKFSEMCGISTNTINSAKRRNSALKSDVIEKVIAAVPNLNLYWLLLGEGEMYLEDNTQSKLLKEKDVKYLTKINDLLEKRVKTLESQLKETKPNTAKEYGID